IFMFLLDLVVEEGKHGVTVDRRDRRGGRLTRRAWSSISLTHDLTSRMRSTLPSRRDAPAPTPSSRGACTLCLANSRRAEARSALRLQWAPVTLHRAAAPFPLLGLLL